MCQALCRVQRTKRGIGHSPYLQGIQNIIEKAYTYKATGGAGRIHTDLALKEFRASQRPRGHNTDNNNTQQAVVMAKGRL